jgi:hypothetical protein
VVAQDAERAARAEVRLARAKAGQEIEEEPPMTMAQLRELLARHGITPRQARRWRAMADTTEAEFQEVVLRRFFGRWWREKGQAIR